MSEPTYLYGYGRKRHIQHPGLPAGTPRCDTSQPPRFVTEDAMADDYQRWNPSDQAAAYVQAARSRPVCKRCEQSHAKES